MSLLLELGARNLVFFSVLFVFLYRSFLPWWREAVAYEIAGLSVVYHFLLIFTLHWRMLPVQNHAVEMTANISLPSC
jgi:hypothetical protein